MALPNGESRMIARRRVGAWLALAMPPVALKLWVLLAIGYYTRMQFAGDAVAVLAACALIVLIARWRIVGLASSALAWLVYALVLGVEVGEAISYYFQASSFNARFFANVRLTNLRSALHAFPVVFIGAAALLVLALAVAGWLLQREARAAVARPRARWQLLALALPVAVMVALPSAGRRLVAVFQSDAALVASARGRRVATWLDAAPRPPEAVHATPGKNLVIVYMESLERVYADNRVFPALTPNLDRWRSEGLDFPGFVSFSGATYTIAGLFASQCGSPYFAAPSRAFDTSGDDPNDTTFHPELTCLGDVLHAAGYRQAFMGGAPLSFANKGAFFRMHHFDEVLGQDELERRHGDRLPAPGWGLYDSDLLRLAARKFDELAAAGRPFNLDVLTLDDHPPDGRPSPGCPSYAASPNSMLQAVHCTDALVGKFLDAISRNPAWKDTIVVVMSDHLSMRNDAWPLYPAGYLRRPLLFVLNAGRGVRTARFYHMDIAPTVLDLMGVRDNATFLAGADRSAATAPGSLLVNDPVDAAVARHVLWANARPVQVCRGGVLIGSGAGGLELGGHAVALTEKGAPLVGLATNQSLGVLVGKRDLVTIVGTPAEVAKRLAARGDAAALWIRVTTDRDPSRRFALTWLGTRGAQARLASVPSLFGLQVRAPECSSVIDRVDAGSRGTVTDAGARFAVATAPLYVPLTDAMDFTVPAVQAWQRGAGWFPAGSGGSWTQGELATLGFTLPKDQCHAVRAAVTVQPYLVASRPRLAVRVLANGQEMTTWHFDAASAGVQTLETPIRTSDPACRVDLRFDFARPGAAAPPYPTGEDPRPLQLDFVKLLLTPVGADVAK